MGGQRLQIIYGLDVLSPLKAWEVIFDYLMKQGISPTAPVKLSEKQIDLNKVSEDIYKFSRKHFRVGLGDIFLDYGAVTAWNHVLISVKDESGSFEDSWGELASEFLETAIFVQAWISDNEYAFWQNAADPLQYEANGRSYEGLPMKSNGLPPPLEQMEIDISANPGRRIIRAGYVESIGHRMWLGPEFFRLVPGAQRDTLRSESWLHTVELENDVLELTVQDAPFVDDATAETQNRLRAILFPNEVRREDRGHPSIEGSSCK